MSPPGAARPKGRHRAARSTSARLRPLLVGAAVIGVVALAALTAGMLGGAATSPGPDVPGSGAAVPGAPASGAVPTATPSGGTSGAPPVGAAPGPPEAPAPAGDPIPGPGAPAVPGDDPAPTALRIPAIDLDVPLILLGLTPDGAIQVPEDADDAGWLTASATPGRTGPAVIAGHVDSADGVAVFTRLADLAAGDEVEVTREDGTDVAYVVTGSERYAKDAFPSAEVYGPAPASVLRLITCGGTFDRAAGSYEDNLVVYAVLAP